MTEDLTKADPVVMRMAIEDARDQIQAMHATALASDLRALILGCAFLFATFATLVMGVMVIPPPLDLGLLLVSALYGLACSQCFWAARPRRMPFPGNEPNSWMGDLAQGYTQHMAQQENLRVMQRVVDRVDMVLRSNGKTTMRGMVIGYMATATMVFWLLLMAAAT